MMNSKTASTAFSRRGRSARSWLAARSSSGQQVQIQFALDQDTQHPQGGAAQRERVLGSRRRLTDGEDTDQVSSRSARARYGR
jgi:hypothetical protein